MRALSRPPRGPAAASLLCPHRRRAPLGQRCAGPQGPGETSHRVGGSRPSDVWDLAGRGGDCPRGCPGPPVGMAEPGRGPSKGRASTRLRIRAGVLGPRALRGGARGGRRQGGSGGPPHLLPLPPPTPAQRHLLPGLPVHQVWRRGAQGVSGGDPSLQDQ